MSSVRFRTARRDDLGIMLDWAAAEGWNPGLEDADAFFAADPGGFFVAEAEGGPVAAISVVNHSPDFAFLGLYIARQAFRGRGIGYMLWRHALHHAGDRVVGLDGVAAQEANYAKSGFVRSGATVRLEGSLAGAASAAIRDAGPDDFDALEKLDTAANGYSRASFLASWLTQTPARRTIALCEGRTPIGFATIRTCRLGAKIGPIVASDGEAGIALLRASVAALPSERVIVDVPSEHNDFTERLRGLDFAETFATARMYRGRKPRGSGTLLAIATMELG